MQHNREDKREAPASPAPAYQRKVPMSSISVSRKLQQEFSQRRGDMTSDEYLTHLMSLDPAPARKPKRAPLKPNAA